MSTSYPTSSSKPVIKPIFLGGTGRSGTTILRDILLKSHSITGCHNELRFMVDPGGAIDLYESLSNTWDPYRAHHAIETYDLFIKKSITGKLYHAILRAILGRLKISPMRYKHMRIDGDVKDMLRIHDRFIQTLSQGQSESIWYGSSPYRYNPKLYETNIFQESDLSNIFIQHFSDFFKKINKEKNKNIIYWLDDTPYCILNAPRLAKVFPNAVFIHIYRDPRSVLASYQQKIWGGGSNDKENIINRIKHVYGRINQAQHLITNNTFIEIKFEELMENPGSEIDKLCEKLLISNSGIETSMLNANKIKDHKQYFKENDIKLINQEFSEILSRYDYANEIK